MHPHVWDSPEQAHDEVEDARPERGSEGHLHVDGVVLGLGIGVVCGRSRVLGALSQEGAQEEREHGCGPNGNVP